MFAYAEKTSNYTKGKLEKAKIGIDEVFAKFSACKKSGNTPDSDNALSLVQELQTYITENYYNCTIEVLKGLGQMYVVDKRFKTNIDAHFKGTAEFISESIAIYCSR